MSKRKNRTAPLTINGKIVHPDGRGRYGVDAADLGVTDLSTFPKGTVLQVHHAIAGSTPNECIVTEFIRIMSNRSARVKGAVIFGMGGWNHTVSIIKSAMVADDLLSKEAARRPDFKFVKGIAGDDVITLIFSQQVDSGSLGYIEGQLYDVVANALKPLRDFRKRVDMECMKLFGK